MKKLLCLLTFIVSILSNFYGQNSNWYSSINDCSIDSIDSEKFVLYPDYTDTINIPSNWKYSIRGKFSYLIIYKETIKDTLEIIFKRKWEDKPKGYFKRLKDEYPNGYSTSLFERELYVFQDIEDPKKSHIQFFRDAPKRDNWIWDIWVTTSNGDLNLNNLNDIMFVVKQLIDNSYKKD